MTLRMLVPMRTRSPSFRWARLIFSPLTKVPLVEPEILDDHCVVFVGDARVLARHHLLDENHVEIARATHEISLLGTIGNSPPWYLPEMNRNANERLASSDV